jgi:hypothetical protein
MATSLVGGQLFINDQAVSIQGNSLRMKDGSGDKVISSQVSGTSVDVIEAVDYTTAKSMVAFDLLSTVENETLVRGWKSNGLCNVIKYVASTGVTKVFQKMCLYTDPEINVSSDGVISVEFEGSQAVTA